MTKQIGIVAALILMLPFLGSVGQAKSLHTSFSGYSLYLAAPHLTYASYGHHRGYYGRYPGGRYYGQHRGYRGGGYYGAPGYRGGYYGAPGYRGGYYGYPRGYPTYRHGFGAYGNSWGFTIRNRGGFYGNYGRYGQYRHYYGPPTGPGKYHYPIPYGHQNPQLYYKFRRY